MAGTNINDIKFDALRTAGYTGASLQDMEYKYYLDTYTTPADFPGLRYKFLVANGLYSWEAEIAFWKAGLSALNAYTSALIAAMSVPPDSTRTDLLDAFFVSTTSIVDKMDLAYFLAGHDSQAITLNIVDPALYTLIPVNSPAFVADQGYSRLTCTAADYYNTGFQASTMATKMTLNNAEMGVFLCDNAFDGTQSSPAECGGDFTQIRAMEHVVTTGVPTTVGGRVNRAATFRNTSGAITTAKGLTHLSRSGATATQIGRNGVQSGGSGTGASTSLDTSTWQIGKAANYAVGSVRQFGFFYAGALLTAPERVTLYNALVTYLTAIGAYTP